MKKVMAFTLALAALLYIAYSVYLVYGNYRFVASPELRVIVAYNKVDLKKYGYLMEAYKSVLTEEGVPWQTAEISRLVVTKARDLAKTGRAVILPDSLVQSMPEEMAAWCREYLDGGGNLAVIYDAGTRVQKGYFRDSAVLADLIGVNYITFAKHKEQSYTWGNIELSSEAGVDFFQVPPGKIAGRGSLLSGYIYGHLSYPVARTEFVEAVPDRNILAQAITPEGDRYPAVIMKPHGKGNLLYVNLPLGYLKAYSDDLPLRGSLRTFLFDVARIPHLSSTYGGKGGLVINWHIDASNEWSIIPKAIERGILDSELRSSIHVTAGDFRDKEGDGLGFDACGKGKSFMEMLLRYGTIGSHGGWAHNWFARNLEDGHLSVGDTEMHIKRNRDCLGSYTTYPIKEYSAPAGVHPQPAETKMLEKLGFTSYYYTGDTGSAPNRTFFNGKMVSDTVIAFPVLPLETSASLFEIKQKGLSEDQVQTWLVSCVDYVSKLRTTRLLYSHLHDFEDYPRATRIFIKYAKKRQREGAITIGPMSDFADFFRRFLKTSFSVRQQGKDLVLTLKNEGGLKGQTVAVPRQGNRIEPQAHQSVAEEGEYYYVTIDEETREKSITVRGY